MEAASRDAPIERDGHWCWEGAIGAARFAFYGKSTAGGDPLIAAALERAWPGRPRAWPGRPRAWPGRPGAHLEVATVRQTHSARVLDAAPGENGEGDALVTTRAGLALRVVTADCVPVVLASRGAIAAVHAGWRGLSSGILTAAVERLGPERPIEAVIGPAIGPCCYEVGLEVASAVAANAGSPTVILDRGVGMRPHLDLRRSARLELERAGVDEVAIVGPCTRCERELLWSYRRDGKGAGRNLALVWRGGAGAPKTAPWGAADGAQERSGA